MRLCLIGFPISFEMISATYARRNVSQLWLLSSLELPKKTYLVVCQKLRSSDSVVSIVRLLVCE